MRVDGFGVEVQRLILAAMPNEASLKRYSSYQISAVERSLGRETE